MSAGRCASTSIMNFLNTTDDFHIFGENHEFILSLLSSINNLNNLISEHKNSNHRIKEELHNKYNNKKYLKNAFFYDSLPNLININQKLKEQIYSFFPSQYIYIGFKEIRWLKYHIKNIELIEKFYSKIVYIQILRNIEDQTNSLKRTWMQDKSKLDISDYISKTNNNIEKFLLEKKNNILSINVSEDNSFLQTIKDFVVSNNSHTNDNWDKAFK